MVEIFKKSGTGNPADYLPILNWFGLGFERELKKLAQRMDGFLQKLIDEHRTKKLENNSMIHHLLSMQQSDPLYYTDEIIKGFIMVIILAGTDTSSVTIERGCPGANLAQRMVGLTLGSLIQCFEWERIDGKEIDMTEGKGTTMPKAHSLQALCKARPIVNKVFH
ncbi:hypothetical protein V6N13_100041 [Hibiscus sabdariffa]